MSELGEHLRRMRERRKLDLRSGADRVGVPHTNLSAYENGSRQPGRGVLGRILDGYEATDAERTAARMEWTADLADPAHDDLTEAAP